MDEGEEKKGRRGKVGGDEYNGEEEWMRERRRRGEGR